MGIDFCKCGDKIWLEYCGSDSSLLRFGMRVLRYYETTHFCYAGSQRYEKISVISILELCNTVFSGYNFSKDTQLGI